MKVLKLTIQPNIGKFWTIGKGYNDYHRLDGFAVIWEDGGWSEYYINVVQCSSKDIKFPRRIQKATK